MKQLSNDLAARTHHFALTCACHVVADEADVYEVVNTSRRFGAWIAEGNSPDALARACAASPRGTDVDEVLAVARKFQTDLYDDLRVSADVGRSRGLPKT